MSRKKKPRNKKRKTSREASFAAIIDESLIYLACSDTKLPRRVICASTGMFQPRDRVDNFRDTRKWAESFMLAGTNSKLTVTSAIHTPRQGQATQMVTHQYDVRSDGSVARKRREYTKKGNIWMPTATELDYMGDRRRRMSAGKWNEYDVAKFPLEVTVTPYIAVCARMVQREEWTVDFSVDDVTTCWPTDAEGVRSLFKTRKKDEGRTRRQALRHWVSEHWRKKRNSDEATIAVRGHLRGVTDFEWFGMRCRVSPPERLES